MSFIKSVCGLSFAFEKKIVSYCVQFKDNVALQLKKINQNSNHLQKRQDSKERRVVQLHCIVYCSKEQKPTECEYSIGPWSRRQHKRQYE